MVDEYQDTNASQFELVHALTIEHRNLCVVGDIDQNIYSWRGATIENILNFEKDYPEIHTTDAKLLQLAKELQAKLVTTDFNLNKVAVLQGATVLNINDLSNALKPVYLPGETMPIFLVKEGKEHHQGIGYLDDGTMVVVEEGRKYVGKRIDVIVTSILQTSSGRMIFTKPTANPDNNKSPVINP